MDTRKIAKALAVGVTTLALAATLLGAYAINRPAAAQEPTIPSREAIADAETVQELAAAFGATVIHFNEGESPCGPDGADFVYVGCFIDTTPNTVWVNRNLSDSDARGVVLHELGHRAMFLHGMQDSEATADAFRDRFSGGSEN